MSAPCTHTHTHTLSLTLSLSSLHHSFIQCSICLYWYIMCVCTLHVSKCEMNTMTCICAACLCPHLLLSHENMIMAFLFFFPAFFQCGCVVLLVQFIVSRICKTLAGYFWILLFCFPETSKNENTACCFDMSLVSYADTAEHSFRHELLCVCGVLLLVFPFITVFNWLYTDLENSWQHTGQCCVL